MYIYVRLLGGYNKLLTYTIPSSIDPATITEGCLVRVPVRTRILPAVVMQCAMHHESLPYTVREIIALEPFPHDATYFPFIQKLSTYYQIDPVICITRMKQFLTAKKIAPTEELFDQAEVTPAATVLTAEQEAVYNFLAPYVRTPAYTPTLLHGITGSGKTEVYKKLIVEAYTQQRSVILLLPEVTLALQFEHLLRAQLPPELPIFGFHSAAPTRMKKLLWHKLLSHEPLLIIGVHLPILLPCANLGLIIVDEEHESGYQEKKHPKINSKEAALLRAYTAHIPILLGSATPSLSSLYNVRTRGWHLFKLTQRFSGALPTIATVFLTDKKQRRSFWISSLLEQALRDRLAKKEQAILFINRRGFSFFVQCTVCRFIFTCNNCSVSLTLHHTTTLLCHYCGKSITQPTTCPSCHASDEQFLRKGIGTQQVVTIVQKLFPRARIGRADLDTTSKKKEWQETLSLFKAGHLDILVGTQTITKGYHFPRVTLVGALWADINLHIPRYNASETALQQLIQVAGRAGRERTESTVIIQTMAEHPLFDFLHETDYLQFYDYEIALRQEALYPPCIRLVEIELKHETEQVVEQDALRFTQALHNAQSTYDAAIIILGPAKPPVHMIKNVHTRLIYLKGTHLTLLTRLFTCARHDTYRSSIFFTPNPVA